MKTSTFRVEVHDDYGAIISESEDVPFHDLAKLIQEFTERMEEDFIDSEDQEWSMNCTILILPESDDD